MDSNNGSYSYRSEQPEVPVEETKPSGYGHMKQSKAAVWIGICILFLVDFLSVTLSLVNGGEFTADFFGNNVPIISSIVLDVILGIFILRGSNSARVLMLIRAVLGLLVFGVSSIMAQNYVSLFIQAGTNIAIILLLTGTSTRLRVRSALALFLVTFIGGTVWGFVPTAPLSYVTYQGENPDYSYRYPSDWYRYNEDEVLEGFAQYPDMISDIKNGNILIDVVQDRSGNGMMFMFFWHDTYAGWPVFPEISEEVSASLNAAFESSGLDTLNYSRACMVGGLNDIPEIPAWEMGYSGSNDGTALTCSSLITTTDSMACWAYILLAGDTVDTFSGVFDKFKESLSLTY